jgi:hypothetical protein
VQGFHPCVGAQPPHHHIKSELVELYDIDGNSTNASVHNISEQRKNMRYRFISTVVLLVGLGVAVVPPANAQTKCRWENKVMICQDLNSDRPEQRYEPRQQNRYDSRSNNSYDNNYGNNYDNRYDNSNSNSTYIPYDERYDDNYRSDNRYGDSYDNRYGDRNGVYGQVNQLYRDILGRKADDNGLRSYVYEVNNGKPLTWVREQLASSSEARDAVNRVYLLVLGRNADSSGLDSYTKALRNGWTLKQVRTELANSTEARSTRRR